MDEIKRTLPTERASERYRAAYERWLDPHSIRAYRRVYGEVFLPSDSAAPHPAESAATVAGKKALDSIAKKSL